MLYLSVKLIRTILFYSYFHYNISYIRINHERRERLKKDFNITVDIKEQMEAEMESQLVDILFILLLRYNT